MDPSSEVDGVIDDVELDVPREGEFVTLSGDVGIDVRARVGAGGPYGVREPR